MVGERYLWGIPSGSVGKREGRRLKTEGGKMMQRLPGIWIGGYFPVKIWGLTQVGEVFSFFYSHG